MMLVSLVITPAKHALLVHRTTVYYVIHLNLELNLEQLAHVTVVIKKINKNIKYPINIF
jgi:hypothetical protein